MREFPIYTPKLIVKHVRIFMNGVVWVKDLGLIEFQRGRLLVPKNSPPKVRQAILELNGLLAAQSNQANTA